jgi:hypothetical protein
MRRHNAVVMFAALMMCSAAMVCAQSPATGSASEPLDHIVAIVNQDVVLESDVLEEMRFFAFEPFSAMNGGPPRELAIQRLINRELIIQQEHLQPQAEIPDAEVQAQIQELRRSIPACAEYHCETEAGWGKFLAAHDFTEAELEARWRERMEVLRFIEVRFRSGVRITPQQISDYYKQTMLPEYAKQKATPPPLATISARIEELLLQRQVTQLLDDWLKTLREQGSVRILQPGEEAP